MTPTSPTFYLGRRYDPALSETPRDSLLYDPADLTAMQVGHGAVLKQLP